MTDAGDVLAPGTRLDELEIERVLGAGGFGITYLARGRVAGCVAGGEGVPAAGLGDAAGGRDGRATDEDRRRGLSVGSGAVSEGGAYPSEVRPPEPGAGDSGVRGGGYRIHGDGVCGGADSCGRGDDDGVAVRGAGQGGTGWR